MLNRFAFLSLITLGGVALIAPTLGVGDKATGVDDAAPQQSVDTSRNSTGQEWYAGGYTLPRGPNGHFYADAFVDGAPVHFMVDTGASVIALTGEDALAAGLEWDDSQVKVIGSGASGAVYGVPARLAQVEVGGVVKHDVEAVIIPQGLEVSLLGQSYLSQLSNLSIKGDRMVLGGS